MTWITTMNRTAESMFEDVDSGGVVPTEADVQSLLKIASEPHEEGDYTRLRFTHEVIRLLGMLVEIRALPRTPIISALSALLTYPETGRRYYAALALWQARAIEAVPAIRERLEVEPSEPVRSTLQRAYEVLRSADPSGWDLAEVLSSASARIEQKKKTDSASASDDSER